MAGVGSAAAQFANLIRDLIDPEKIVEWRALAQNFRDEPDWPWCAFVLSFATNGGTANWDKRVKPRLEEFRWSRVAALSNADRLALLAEIPNPHRRSRLTLYLDQIFQRILKAGGPAAIAKGYGALPTAEERIAYLSSFPGIGPKYARNIPMDSLDPVVCEHFAIDSRINGILVASLGRKPGYAEGEAFLNQVARILNLDAWALDRFLYHNERRVRDRLQAPLSATAN